MSVYLIFDYLYFLTCAKDEIIKENRVYSPLSSTLPLSPLSSTLPLSSPSSRLFHLCQRRRNQIQFPIDLYAWQSCQGPANALMLPTAISLIVHSKCASYQSDTPRNYKHYTHTVKLQVNRCILRQHTGCVRHTVDGNIVCVCCVIAHSP